MQSYNRRQRSFKRRTSGKALQYALDMLEERWLLTTVTLDPGTTYQTIQGWGSAPIYPTSQVTIAQAGNILRTAGMNTVRITAGPGEFTYTTGGNLSTPVPISANLADNVAKFGMTGENQEADLVKWLETNGLQPSRTKIIGSLWSPPQWMKISTGTLMTWTNNGVQQSAYDPVLPYGDYGGNTAGGRINPTMYTDWARFVLSDVEWWQQQTGLPMYGFSFQNEPDVQVNYSSAFLNRIAVNPNDPSQGTTTGQWQLYGDALQALSTELAAHPEITTKFWGPELEALGPAASNPWFLSQYAAIRQNLVSRGLLGDLGGYATHQYQNASDGDAAIWDAFYNGSGHAAQILSNGTSSNLGWLPPQPGVGGDGKEIWQTETDGEAPTWTKDGAMSYGLKILDALVYGHVSGYTTWDLVSYNPGDSFGMVDINDVNNPTNSYKFDAFSQFSRWINPGAQMIGATFDNGQASIGGANSLDTYNALNVASFNQAQDQRLTTVFVNMQTSDQTVTVNLPAGMNFNSLQVYETSGTQKFAQLSDLVPVNGKVTLTIPASSFVTVTGTYTTLPAPWVSTDIGGPSPAGAASFNPSTNAFTISGGGSDIWNNSDQFQFASQGVSGNATMVARVTSLQNTDPWAKAGVMFRDTAAANAMFADVVVSSSSGVSFQWRNSTGGYAGGSTISNVLAPAWVKLVRNGSSFSAFYATTSGTPSASDWIQIGTAQTIAMGTSVQAGLAVTSHNNGTATTATFTGVQVNQNPTVATAASASPGTVSGTTTNLSVLGADADGGGESNLSYTWSVSGPAAVTFSSNGTNASKNTTATFTQAGTYTFTATITDSGGLSTTSSVGVVVDQVLSSIAVTPGWVGLVSHGQQQYAAVAYDQFGSAMNPQPAISWSVLGTGTITSTGLYTAQYGSISAGVQATSGSVNGVGWVTVTNAAPTVATAASANSNPVTGTSTNLSVLGADRDGGGESNLSYTWSATGPAAVAFSSNGTNASKNTTATFTAAGTYNFTATITDAGGLSTTSSVSVTVNLLPNSADVGSVGQAGSSSFSNGTYTIGGSGADIWNTADGFHYTWMNLSGDGQIVAQVNSLTNTDGWAKAGVMIRDSSAANAEFVDLMITPGNGAAFQYRSSTGGNCTNVQSTGKSAPYWVKLVRSGNTFAGYISPDGTTWTALGSASFSMSSSALVGLAVTSHNNSSLCTATFSNVAVTPYVNLALHQSISASSTASGSAAANAVDGSTSTAWSSASGGSQSLTLDLGSIHTLSHVQLNWGSAYAVAFSIQISSDNTNWTSIYSTTSGSGGVLDLSALAVSARYVKLSLVSANSGLYSLNELAVYGA